MKRNIFCFLLIVLYSTNAQASFLKKCAQSIVKAVDTFQQYRLSPFSYQLWKNKWQIHPEAFLEPGKKMAVEYQDNWEVKEGIQDIPTNTLYFAFARIPAMVVQKYFEYWPERNKSLPDVIAIPSLEENEVAYLTFGVDARLVPGIFYKRPRESVNVISFKRIPLDTIFKLIDQVSETITLHGSIYSQEMVYFSEGLMRRAGF